MGVMAMVWTATLPTMAFRDVVGADTHAPPVDAGRCVAAYAALVERSYAQTAESARQMRAAIQAFCAAPSQDGLERARSCWCAARDLYGRTEVFRFGNGPIDSTRGGVETFVNAWPVDEAYIDAVDGAVAPGIIANPTKYPSVGKAILRVHNQRGGETNVCTGWHAVEFLLWGRTAHRRAPAIARSVTSWTEVPSTPIGAVSSCSRPPTCCATIWRSSRLLGPIAPVRTEAASSRIPRQPSGRCSAASRC